MWNCSFFDEQTMTEWTSKLVADKTYANAVTFFNLKMRNKENYKATRGEVHEFDVANMAVKLTKLLIDMATKQQEEHMLVIKDIKKNSAENHDL